MIGIVLAAGQGTRLRPLTETLPKSLLVLNGQHTILDLILANLSEVGVNDVVLVTGFAADRIDARISDFEDRYRLSITTIFNDKARVWNNAYSLWLACDHCSAEPALLINGDTVHPASVLEQVLKHHNDFGDACDIILAVDDKKRLAEEEMKLLVDGASRATHINKSIDPACAYGEYIGVSLIEPAAERPLADALRATFERDTTLYYEDGYQELINRGGVIEVVPIGNVEWVEVDNHVDLARAKDIACRY